MSTILKSFYLILSFSVILILVGCTGIVCAGSISPTIIPIVSKDMKPIPSATPFQPLTDTPTYIPPTFTPLPTFTPTWTNTPFPTDTPSPTASSISTETPEFVWNPAGEVIAPILMYHHISNDFPGLRYSVSIDDFQAQMQALHDWGYTSITSSELANAIIYGADLPNRPVVITFDDGYDDVYKNALPIMNEMGFVGNIYIYVDHIGLSPYISSEHMISLAENGWEIGSHSMSHMDLSKNHNSLDYEVNQSRWALENLTGESVNTFAFPYGKSDDYVIDYVRNAGYLAAMGLGLNFAHTTNSVFNLDRIEVYNDYSLSTFSDLLPWSDK